MINKKITQFFQQNNDGLYLSRLFIYALIIFLISIGLNYWFYNFISFSDYKGYLISNYPEYDPFVYHWPDTVTTFTSAVFITLMLGSFLSALVLLGFLQAANFLKLIFLQSHINFGDILLLDDLFFSVNLKLKITLVIVPLILSFIIIFFYKKRLFLARLIACSPVFLGILVFYFQPTISKNFIEKKDMVNSFTRDPFGLALFNGPLFTIVYSEIYQHFLKKNFSDFKPIVNFPEFDFRSINKKMINKKPNIHIVVLESFLHPYFFPNLKYNKPPISGKFSELDSKNNSSSFNTIRSTGAAEFEILCGIPNQPAFAERVFNVLLKSKSILCLPNFLRDIGYSTIATHPNTSAMYNRKNVYKIIGFERINFSDSLDMHDKDDMWLNDMALFKQNIELIKNNLHGDKPFLNYVLTVGGHFPYNLDRKRPPQLKIEPNSSSIISKVLQVSYYTSAALSYWIEELEKIDPNSIVFIVSDHLPYFVNPDDKLISNIKNYKPNLLTKKFYLPANQTFAMFLANKQVVNVGNFEQFSSPNIIIDQLSSGSWCARKDTCTHKEDYIIVAGGIYKRMNPKEELCNKREPSAICKKARDRLNEYENLYMGFLKNSF